MARSFLVFDDPGIENRTRGFAAWPVYERPRERLFLQGAPSLSAAELLAILIGTGSRGFSPLELAGRILEKTSGVEGRTGPSLADLLGIPGIGPAKAARILAGIEIGRRCFRRHLPRSPRLTCAESVARWVRPRMEGLDVEVFAVLSVDIKNRPVLYAEVARGTREGVSCSPREIFQGSLKAGASGMILIHNHPSGDCAPSREDEEITRRLRSGAELLGLRFLDHVIVTDDTFFSFAESRTL